MQSTAEAWPLVGRRGDVDAIAAALTRPGRVGAVIAGPSGVGKTRLLEECLALAKRADHLTIRTSGSQLLRDVPLGALLPLMPPDVGTDAATVLASARQLLKQHAAGRRAVLAVDDAHLLDDTSVWLLRQFAIAGELRLLLATRDGEAVPDDLSRLWIDGLLMRLDLAPLDLGQIDVLLHRALGAPIDADALRRLADKAEGNVLFLRELVTGAVTDGTLVHVDGSWRASGEFAPTTRLRELVTARIAGLSADDREALELLALAEQLSAADLAALSPAADLVVLEARGLLRVTRDDHRTVVTPAHPLHADVLLAELPALRGVVLRRRLADHLEPLARRRDDAVRIAFWRLDAGDRPDPAVLLAAARISRAVHDYPATTRLAAAAMEVQPSTLAAHLLGDARYHMGDHAGAESALAQAEELATSDADRVGVALSRIDVTYWGRGDLASAQRLADEAAEASPESAPLFRAKAASLATFAGRPAAALDGLGTLAATDPRTAAQISMARSLAFATSGATGAAQVAVREAVAASLSLDGPAGLVHPVAHRTSDALALAFAGDLAGAASAAEEGLAAAVVERLSFAACKLELAAARVAAMAGDLSACRAHGDAVVTRAISAGQPLLVRAGLAFRALGAACTGDIPAATEDLRSLDQSGQVFPSMYDVDIARARAWVFVAAGATADAVGVLQRAVGLACDGGAAALAVEAAYDIVRLAGPAVGLDLLVEVADAVEGELGPALVASARAAAGNDVEEFEAAALRLETIGARLLAAELWASAASNWSGCGRARRAAAAAANVERLRSALPAVITPGLLLAPASSPLTAREREIAVMVAGGMTSRQVADQLVVSVRTVDNHLQRVFNKLGIRRRSELGAALGLERPVRATPHLASDGPAPDAAE